MNQNAILNIVAHDLRSPIGGIISLIQIMLEEKIIQLIENILSLPKF